jgi:hypothetical protein
MYCDCVGDNGELNERIAFLQNAVGAIQGSYFIAQVGSRLLPPAAQDITDEVIEFLSIELI